jgi:hypothetical protein
MRAIAGLALCWLVLSAPFLAREVRAESYSELAERAQAGDAAAQFRLGQWYFWAIPSARDLGKALHWYCRAAMQGHRDAQIQLGVLYWQGAAVARNPVHAYLWFDLAAQTAPGIAEEYRERIARDYLRPADIAMAKALAAAWHKTPQCPVQSS